MWRYRELLPVANDPTVGLQVGFTPLVKANRLAKKLGIRELWIKNDTVNYPTLSFKDRVVSVALSRARELGFDTVACASTGNLANSVAANAAFRRIESLRFLIPTDLEQGKIINSLVYGANVIGIKGHYDEVNRLCAEIAGKFGWAFVNVNMRPYYAEGSKSMAYEIVEQLGWRLPRHTVVPMASGSLLTKIQKGYQEFVEARPGAGKRDVHSRRAGDRLLAHFHRAKSRFGLSSGRSSRTRLRNRSPSAHRRMVSTRSKLMKDTGAAADDVTDDEIRDAIKLLAETEGIFAETARRRDRGRGAETHRVGQNSGAMIPRFFASPATA